MDKSLATGAELDKTTFDDFVRRLRHHVRGEGVNWHHTADALFTVQERKILFGIDRDYADKLAVAVEDSMYFSPKEYWDASDDSMRATLDDIADNEHDKPFLMIDVMDQWDLLADLDDHTVSGWDESWEHVNSHFTKEAAEAFIRRKKHDYPKGLRVYVEANIYCWEFNAIVKGLIDGQIVHAAALASQPAAQEQDKIDAARYRWLRDQADNCNFDAPLAMQVSREGSPLRFLAGADLDGGIDRAIDAAQLAQSADTAEG